MNRIDKLEKATGDHRYALERIQELEWEMINLRRMIVDKNLLIRKLDGTYTPRRLPSNYEVPSYHVA